MKIQSQHTERHQFENAPLLTRISSGAPRIQDSFVTMNKNQSVFGRIQGVFTGGWGKIKDLLATAWEWIYWVIRLCPSENTRIESVQAIIDDPIETAKKAKDNPAEFLAELIVATLINPSAVSEKIKGNRKEVGKFVRKFKEVVENHIGHLIGKNGILAKFLATLGIFKGLDLEQVFVKFALDRPTLFAEAMRSYCKKALSEIGDKKGGQLEAIKTVLNYLLKVADQAETDPTGFLNFLKGLFAKSSFNFEEIGALADKCLDQAKLSSEEQAAFRTCSENNHEALHRLDIKPDFLGLSKDTNLGVVSMYGALLSQMGTNDFAELAKLFKEDYPLGAEVCEHMADIAKYPSQFKRVCSNLKKATEVLSEMVEDYKNPPNIDD